MKRMETLERMGRKYLADTYGADEGFYKVDYSDRDSEGCYVNFTDDFTVYNYLFEWNRKTKAVTFILFRNNELEGEIEIGEIA